MSASATALGWRDLFVSVRYLGLGYWLAHEDMNQRFTRTALGPWWNVIGAGALVAAMGLTFGVILNQPLREFLPYIAASVSLWTCFAQMIVDAPSTFSRNAGLISVYSIPLTTYVYRMVFDRLINLFFSMTILVVVFVIFQKVPTIHFLLFPVAIGIYFLLGVGAGLFFGVLGTRFKDLAPALGSIITLLFLMTPVFWNRISITDHPWLVLGNPFYHLLEVGRAPLLGSMPTDLNYIVAGGLAVGMLALGAFTFAFGRRTIYYWI